MCGKFTAKSSWTEIVDYIWSTPLDEEEDRTLTYRVMNPLPVVLLDIVTGKRRVVPMRWGFPDLKDWRRPQPIHARAETIDTTKTFAQAFRDGQRGIVWMKSFNEAPDIEGPTIQHVIVPESTLAAAVIWRRFEISASPEPFFACVLVTVPANQLISGLPTDRMPAFLAREDWQVWLGESSTSLEKVKACLRTVEGASWTMNKEERASNVRRSKSMVSDPTGLF
jgi:putative SOS response-associated peptidase YedK